MRELVLEIAAQLRAAPGGVVAVSEALSKIPRNDAAWTYTPNGAIDEVAIYHGALTAQQISAIYSAPDGKCL